MVALCDSSCEACRVGSPRLSEDEIRALLAEVPGWSVSVVDGVPRLTRRFKFRDFEGALEFTRRVGAAAGENGHHPRLVTEWGRVDVEWWTHKIGGLHRSDFVMAAKTDVVWDQLSAGSESGAGRGNEGGRNKEGEL